MPPDVPGAGLTDGTLPAAARPGADRPRVDPDPVCARPPVILTRPAGQNDALARRLRAVGRYVLDLPSLRLTPLAGASPDPSRFDVVIFVSGNAARMFLDARCREASATVPWPDHVAGATVGPSSSAALRDHPGFGAAPRLIQPAADAATFDSESLWTALVAKPLPRSALMVRGGSGPEGRGRDWLAGKLREAGVDVTVHSAYQREPATWSDASIATLQAWAAKGAPSATAPTATPSPTPAIVLVTSREGADALLEGMTRAGLLDWYAGCRLIATHPRIASHVAGTLSALGRQPLLQISSPRDDDIFAAIESTP